MRKAYLAVLFVVLIAAASIPAMADQMVLGGTLGSVYFCSTGGIGADIVISTSSSCSPQGGTSSSPNSGNFESPTGLAIIQSQPWGFTFPTGLTIGSLSGNYFSVASQPTTTQFSWGGNGTSVVTGDVTWTLVKDGSAKPQFLGGMVVTANGNLGALGLAYPVGKTASIDFTVDLGTNPTLDDVFYHTGGVTSTVGRISSGEVPAVPEPTSIFFLGSGILAAGTLLRLRRRKV